MYDHNRLLPVPWLSDLRGGIFQGVLGKGLEQVVGSKQVTGTGPAVRMSVALI